MHKNIKQIMIVLIPLFGVGITACNSGAGSGFPTPDNGGGGGGGKVITPGKLLLTPNVLQLDNKESATATLSLVGSANVNSLNVLIQSSDPSITTVSNNSCTLSSESSLSTCKIIISALSKQGTSTISAIPTNPKYESQNLIATVNLNTWIATDAIPPTVQGQANAVGFTSDQLGNLYLSYQGADKLTVYRYLFGQTNPSWSVLAESQNMSLSAYSSSLAVSTINVLNLAYLYTPNPNQSGEIHYLSALPDKINFTNVKIPVTYQIYQPTDGCPSPIEHQLMASEATMTLDSADKQVIAYSDELNYSSQSVQVSDTLICTAPSYNGSSKLSLYFASDSSIHSQLSDGTATQIAITATPVSSFGKAYPLFIAYKDGANSGGVSVQTISNINGQITNTYVGNKNLSNGAANFISIAADNTGIPYVAYQNDQQKLSVKKYVSSSSQWQDIGNLDIDRGIARWISITINPKTNTPYVAYQEDNKIKTLAFINQKWQLVGNPIDIPPNLPSTYTNLIMRQESIDNWQPALAFQPTPQGSESSFISAYYFMEDTVKNTKNALSSPISKLMSIVSKYL